jgi:murein DD-endopeptidase MepM/ murein hydrolase activator NlpD
MAHRDLTHSPESAPDGIVFPRRHAAVAGTLCIALSVIAFSVTGEDSVSKQRSQVLDLSIEPARDRIDETLSAALEQEATQAEKAVPTPAPPAIEAPPPVAALPIATRAQESLPTAAASVNAAIVVEEKPEPHWQTITVQRGDSLSRIFQRQGLGTKSLVDLLRQSGQSAELKRLHPGEKLGFQIENGKLQALRYNKSALVSVYIEREGDSDRYSSRELKTAPEVRWSYREATINDSLFVAGKKAGLPDKVIMNMANIFGGVIDFVYDTRSGDAFSVLYEEQYLDGKKIGAGKILAAEFTNRGVRYPAFFYRDANGETGYYNEDGVSMRKAFLRSPVDFTRISSHFNPSRLHPIFKTRRPHKGIDYAAARGTPVHATGKGRVIEAGYSRANGNYVVIKHGESFVTKYLHLHKKQVAKGQRVRQGQIIGQVGSTGYATGPHLHYEFMLNGVHRDPRTILAKLPKARSIAAAEMPSFKAALTPLKQQFAKYGNQDSDAPLVVAYQNQND